ncbi:MAG: SMC-Scp complex subunit ScpB [Thermoanaerobaculales bacterium]|nr:SMC-Scp complex subunit ScpB [Thermoanaerobaculales bacterium]
MDTDSLNAFVEAALLTSRGPVSIVGLTEAIGDAEVGEELVVEVLECLQELWRRQERGIRLETVAGGWRCVTPPNLDDALRAFHGLVAKQRLSQAGLEVLAIVGYRQPVTLPEINFVRGANSTGVVKTLLDRGLIRIAGRKKVVGKPFLYRTTKEFLVHFGLDTIEELPDPEKMVIDEVPEAN